ncbi:hypothetical protein V8C35DRAFT_289311 [Trichoderma chlorosporum]
MSDNTNYSHELYHLAVRVHRRLTLICWLCQQLQQLTAFIIHEMDEERERGNRDRPDSIIADLNDIEMHDLVTYDNQVDDTDMIDNDVHNADSI